MKLKIYFCDKSRSFLDKPLAHRPIGCETLLQSITLLKFRKKVMSVTNENNVI